MIVYKATNKINGKIYVGRTIHKLDQRIKEHKLASKNGKSYFYNAIKKYNISNFSWSILSICKHLKELN